MENLSYKELSKKLKEKRKVLKSTSVNHPEYYYKYKELIVIETELKKRAKTREGRYDPSKFTIWWWKFTAKFNR